MGVGARYGTGCDTGGLKARGSSDPCVEYAPVNARLVIDGPGHRRACLTGYTDSGKVTGPLEGSRAFRSFESSSALWSPEVAMREGCGLLADGQTRQSINHSGIRRDCVSLSGPPVAGSPHRRPRCSSYGRGEVRLNFVRSREQGARSVAARLASTPFGVERGLAAMALLIQPEGEP